MAAPPAAAIPDAIAQITCILNKVVVLNDDSSINAGRVSDDKARTRGGQSLARHESRKKGLITGDASASMTPEMEKSIERLIETGLQEGVYGGFLLHLLLSK